MVKACIFDLDGTLLNTLADLADALNYALNRSGFPKRTLEEVRNFVGNGVYTLVERALPSGTDAKHRQTCLSDFKSYYELHKQDKTCLYDGIYDLVASLKAKGIRIAIVSNKFDKAVKELAKYYFSDMIDVAIGESPQIRKKPAPDTVFMALDMLGVTKEETLYIGDSDTDVLTAKNAGVPFVGVTWGFRDEALLRQCGADTLIHKPSDLLRFLV